MNDIIEHYLRAALGTTEDTALDPGLITYLAGLEQVRRVAPDIARHIVQELADQRANLKLIASENYSSLASQAAMGNLLTDKYAEGVPGHRFYAGCDNVDAIEQRAAELACSLFGADHAYVQPHSGADANLVAFWAILSARVEQPALQRLEARSVNDLDASDWAELRTALGNQRLLGMDLGAGGHLTHGYRPNVSGRMFEAHSYGVDAASGRIDYDALAAQAQQVRPLVLLAGYSAYPRALDFRRLRAIADSVDAVLMVDMAHFAGLVAGGVLRDDQNPIPFADIITSTTHKTLRGPRGGMVLCRAELADAVDRGCPLVLGGPLPHVLAAKAVAFGEASAPQFAAYAKQVVANAQALAAACQQEGLQVVTGGTDNHLMLLDLTAAGITGRQGESALRACAITCNRNALPGDLNGPWYTSGLRLGTPALTTLGMQPQHMAQVAQLIRRVLQATEPELVAGGRNAGKPSKANFRLDADVAAAIVAEVRTLLAAFPVYPQLDLPLLQRLVGLAADGEAPAAAPAVEPSVRRG